MFKFLFKSKFLGFVESPVGVFLFFFKLKKNCMSNQPFSSYKFSFGCRSLTAKTKQTPHLKPKLLTLAKLSPSLITGIFIIVFILSLIKWDWFEIWNFFSCNQQLKKLPYQKIHSSVCLSVSQSVCVLSFIFKFPCN